MGVSLVVNFLAAADEAKLRCVGKVRVQVGLEGRRLRCCRREEAEVRQVRAHRDFEGAAVDEARVKCAAS